MTYRRSHISYRWLVAVLIFLVYAPGARAQEGPEFLFRFDGPCGRRVQGAPGETYATDFKCLLSTRFNDTGAGARAWSMAIGAEGGEISRIWNGDNSGVGSGVGINWLRNNGFERSEIVGEVGRRSAISVVVLSQETGVTLPPQFSGGVARVGLYSTFGSLGTEQTISLRYVDGLESSDGSLVRNTVTHQGRVAEPIVQSCSITLVSNQFGCEPESTRLGMMFQRSGSSVESPRPFADWLGNWTGRLQDPAQMTVVSGEPTEVYIAMVSRLPDAGAGGVQGWSIGYSVQGDLDLLGATTAGTIAASNLDDPPGLIDRGFEKTEIVDPGFRFQGQGVVSAVVFSFSRPVTLSPVGTATILNITVEGREEGVFGRVVCDEELADSGQGTSMVATVGGAAVSFDCCPVLNIDIRRPPVLFHLGDVNLDGLLDIADPIYFVSAMFLGQGEQECEAASDFNQDGALDISDAISIIQYLFLGAQPPPAPFPDCVLPDAEGLGCQESSVDCS